MKEIDDTPVPEGESECPEWFQVWLVGFQCRVIAQLEGRIAKLNAEVADLHYRKRISRQQATDQDPEWH